MKKLKKAVAKGEPAFEGVWAMPGDADLLMAELSTNEQAWISQAERHAVEAVNDVVQIEGVEDE